MKYAIVGSLTALFAGAGLALAQGYLPPPRVASASDREVTPDQATPIPTTAPPAGPGFGPPDGPQLLPPYCGGPACGCRDPFWLWFDAEYLLWWVKENRFPPLLTAGPPSSLGVLGQPGTSILVGDTSLDDTNRSGGRITIGGWVTEYRGFGLEGNFFMMETRNKEFTAGATGAPGSPVFARPFFNVLTGTESALPIAFPGVISGSTTATTRGETSNDNRFFGAGFDFLLNLCCETSYRCDFLIGYRYLSLDDHFAFIANELIAANVPNIGGNASVVTDRIDTSSRFNGGDLGLRGEWRGGPWSVRGTAKMAIGSTDETANVNGATTIFVAAANGAPTVFPGGFLARPSNIGVAKTEQFAVVPEVGVTVGYQALECLRLTLGYNFLYWSNVVRTGDQVNRNVNVLEVPSVTGTANGAGFQQSVLLRSVDYWAHGISAGIELRY
jgi:hypothetical protein